VARDRLEESLSLSRQHGHQRGIAAALEGLASLAAAEGQPRRSLRLDGAAATWRAAAGQASDAAGEQAAADRQARLFQDLGTETAATAWAEGQAMSLEQGIAYALSEAPSEQADA
jgi:hypothetical protein